MEIKKTFDVKNGKKERARPLINLCSVIVIKYFYVI